MSYQTITLDAAGGVAILTFNRPRVLNAFDPVLVEETMQAMAKTGRRFQDSKASARRKAAPANGRRSWSVQLAET